MNGGGYLFTQASGNDLPRRHYSRFPQPGGKISFHFSRKEESRRENIRRGNNPFEYERTPFLAGRGNISGEINREEWREIHPIFVRVRRGDARRTRS